MTSPPCEALLPSKPERPNPLSGAPPPTSPPSLVANTMTPSYPTRLYNVQLKKRTSKKEERRLVDGYQVQRFDVLCMRRGSPDLGYHQHVGNNRFRVLVEMRVVRYMAAKTKDDKTMIIREIIDAVQSAGGRFIRREKRQPSLNGIDDYASGQHDAEGSIYYDVGYRKTIDKVGKAIRTFVKTREKNAASKEERPSIAATTPRITPELSPVARLWPHGISNFEQQHRIQREHEGNHHDGSNRLLATDATSRDNELLWKSSQRQQQNCSISKSNTPEDKSLATLNSENPWMFCDRRVSLHLRLLQQRLFLETAQMNYPFQSRPFPHEPLAPVQEEDPRRTTARFASFGNMPSSVTPQDSTQDNLRANIVDVAEHKAISKGGGKKRNCSNKPIEETAHGTKMPTIRDHVFGSEQNDCQAKHVVESPTPPQTLSLEEPNMHDQFDDDDSDSSSFYPHESELNTSHGRTPMASMDSNDDDDDDDDHVVWHAHPTTLSSAMGSSDLDYEQDDDDESDTSCFYPRESELHTT